MTAGSEKQNVLTRPLMRSLALSAGLWLVALPLAQAQAPQGGQGTPASAAPAPSAPDAGAPSGPTEGVSPDSQPDQQNAEADPPASPGEPLPSGESPSADEFVGDDAPADPPDGTLDDAQDGGGQAAASPPEGPSVPKTICDGKRIESIEVKGHGRVSADDIRATIRLRTGLPCTDGEVTRDAQSIWDLGYFSDVRVDAELAGRKAVKLIFTVIERPAIGAIAFDGNDEIEASDLQEKVTLREGAVLSEPAVKRQLEKIREYYAEKGFFLAEVGYELDPLPNDEVRIRFVISEGEEVAVRRIRFLGNQAIDDAEIKRYLQTGETSVFSIVSSNNAYRREVFDQDLNTVQALYYDRGYLMVEVGAPHVELSPDRRYIDLSIPITEGPRFRVGRVRVTEVDESGMDVDPLGGRRQLRERVDLNPGDWFSRTTIAENLQDITRYYRDRGYAKVQVIPQTDLDAESRIVQIVVQIQRGPLVYLERINFAGNSKTRDTVLRREMRVVEGQLYSQTLVERSKERITALGFFESVDVTEEPGSEEDRLTLTFQVAERPTGTFQLGAGFSSQETFLLTGQIQQQNLFGRGQSLSLDLQLSGIRQLAQVRFVEPYLYGTEWTAMVDLFKILRQQASFDRDSTGASLTLGHPILESLFDDSLRLFANYHIEHVDIAAASGGFIGSNFGQNYQLFLPVPLHNLFREGLTSSIRLSLQWDTRNNRLYPSEGVFATASSEIADKYVLGSQTNFVRHRLNFRYYQPLFWQFVAKLNAEWGLITSRSSSGVPIYERFFLGGIMDVRGFRQQSIGPRIGQPSNYDPVAAPSSRGVPFGGNMQFYYNLELEFPLIEAVGIKGVIFHDAGNAWNMEDRLCGPEPSFGDAASSSCGLDTRLRTSWGFGLRWFSPLGPLRFEWGFPFSPRKPYENDYEFQFMVGNAF